MLFTSFIPILSTTQCIDISSSQQSICKVVISSVVTASYGQIQSIKSTAKIEFAAMSGKVTADK